MHVSCCLLLLITSASYSILTHIALDLMFMYCILLSTLLEVIFRAELKVNFTSNNSYKVMTPIGHNWGLYFGLKDVFFHFHIVAHLTENRHDLMKNCEQNMYNKQYAQLSCTV